jgi:hypothetical protein
MNINALVTTDEAADLLGVAPAVINVWAGDGLLPVCAYTEGGEFLFRRWRVEQYGPKLAASEPVRFKKTGGRRGHAMFHDCRRLPCGCAVAGARGDQDGRDAGNPIWFCRIALSLDAAAQLARAFSEAAPDDPFFRRLASVTASALARHLGGPLIVVKLPAKAAHERHHDRAPLAGFASATTTQPRKNPAGAT